MGLFKSKSNSVFTFQAQNYLLFPLGILIEFLLT